MHIRPITQADLPDFANVVGRSMWDDEIMAYTAPWKEQYPDSFFRHCLYRVKIRFYRGEEMFLCVTDEQDPDWNGSEVVTGYCGYSTTVKSVQKPVRSGWLGNAFEQQALNLYGWYSRVLRLNRSSAPKAESHFRRTCEQPVFGGYLASLPEEHRKKLGDQHWELEILGTHPDFRRRGVGKLMLEEGKKRARKDGVPLVLIGSVMGEYLYLSAGFREVNRIKMLPDEEDKANRLNDLDLGFGKGKGLTWAVMTWEPESMRTD